MHSNYACVALHIWVLHWLGCSIWKTCQTCTITYREYNKLLLELLLFSESVNASTLRHIKLVHSSQSCQLGTKEIKQIIRLNITQYTYLWENWQKILPSEEAHIESFFTLVDLSRVKISVWNLLFTLVSFIIYKDCHHFADENRLTFFQQ